MHATDKLHVSERRACKAVEQPRSTQRYQPRQRDGECELTKRISELASKHPRYGYRRIHALLVREGHRVNRKRVHRIWKTEGLKVPHKQRKRHRVGTKDGSCIRNQAKYPNHVWSIDFAFDQTADWRTVKILAVVDEYTRLCLDLPASRHLTSTDVVEVLARQFAANGAPKFIRSDNGPEFIAQAIRQWLAELDVGTLYIEPGSPWQNAYAETFVGKLRDELLDRELFNDMKEVHYLLNQHRHNYNHHRPHSSLGYLTPAEFADRCMNPSSEATPLRLDSTQTYQPETFIGAGT